ncbi:hypothetical protein BD779DRAFT_1496720 [Infundibulicybe gibba]|nr:hypothetical protein BD779DRAFT_1496720 [Infundibulicybe gibba]
MSISSHRLASLQPGERAAFATTSRLLSCLITESLARALYFPLHGFEATGVAVVFTGRHADLIQSIIRILSGPGWTISKSIQLRTSKSPLQLWEKFASSIHLSATMVRDISEELISSVKWQGYVDWEQSIVEGHPTHPMHKTRYFLPPLPDFAPGSYDLYHPKLRLVAVPKADLKITYDFEEYMKPILRAVSDTAAEPFMIWEDHVIVPVHELQFPEVKVYPAKFSIPLLAQQSIRSVVVPDLTGQISLKLGVGIKLTSAVRTISPASAYLELASVVHAHPDGEIAKHCAAIIREAHENGSEVRGERLIVCTALVESGHAGENGHLPAVIRVFGLDNEDKCIQWLDRFVRIRVHPETLRASTGVELDFLDGHSIIASDLDDVYTRMYHTVFHNHLQQLIRVLGLHYNGKGWAIVRNHLRNIIPRDHRLYDAWLSPEVKTLPGKCFLRMRMSDMYRFHLHGPFLNLIHYEGVNVDNDSRSRKDGSAM